MKFTILLLLLLPLFIEVKGQHQPDSCSLRDVEFMEYLVNNRLFEDAIHLSQTLNPRNCHYSDSIWYLKAWSHYNLKQLDTAAINFLRVKNNSPLHQKSRFFAAYCSVHEGDVNTGHQILRDLSPSYAMIDELKNTQLAGYYLLQRNLDSYRHLSSSFTNSYYSFAENQKVLNEIYFNIEKFNKKSPLMAGLLSAIIPGAGKFYAGKFGSGLSSLFTVGILGAITWESYSKNGLADPKTIIFGSILSVAYSANIYGSVYSIKAYRDEFNQQMDQRILFHIHIPLRNVFN